MPRSPQVIIRERDLSSFPTTSSDTVIAIIGYATKGPIGKAISLSGRNAFVKTFGSIPKNAPWGHMAAYKAFRQGRVIFYRIANDSAVGAEYVIQNASDATAGYQEFERNSVINYGEFTVETAYEFDVTVDGAMESTTIAVTSPKTGDWEINVLVKNISDALIAGTAGATAALVNGKIRIISDTTGESSTILIEDTTGTGESLFTLLEGVGTAVAGALPVAASATDTIIFKAIEKGSDTDKISLRKVTTYDAIDDRDVYSIHVYFDGEEVEVFEDVSLDPVSDDFFVTLMNRDPENNGSSYVNVVYEDIAVDGDLLFTDGTYQLGSGITSYAEALEAKGSEPDYTEYDYKQGQDGAPESGGAGLFVNALSSSSDLANAEKTNFHVLITPDNGSQTTQNAAISLAESRGDFFYLADTPLGLSYTEVVDWHNGAGYGRDAAINSSFSAVYWPWLKDINPRDNEYLWCPPSVFLGEKLLQVDRNYAPWYAPAGDLRGRVVANDAEFSPSLAQRDYIYSKPNCVNPIVNFSSKGLVIYGQKTSLRANSALNRVNVRRMAIYASKLIKTSMEGLIFEPHLPDSWAKASEFITRILEPIRRDNGLEDYQVIIDGTTNDADAIANNVMKGIIRLVPVNAIESIDLTISFLSPGVSIQ